MKKKLFSFIFAFALIVTGAVCLTACGEGPTLSNLSIFLNDVEYSQWDNYIGEFEYGDTNNLNYEVRAYFDDSSHKVLQSTDYIVTYKFNDEEISSLPQTFNDIGFYSIQIEYQGMVRKINFDVNPARGNYQTVVENNKRVWTYRQTQPDISITDESIVFGENVNPKRYIEKDKVANPNAMTSLEAGSAHEYQSGNQGDLSIIPGSYYLFVVVPAHGNYAESYSSLIEVTVNKATLKIANEDKVSALTYSYTDNYNGKATLNDISMNKSTEATINGVTLTPEEIETGSRDNLVYLELKFENPTTVLNYNDYKTGKPERILPCFNSEDEENFSKLFELPAGWDVTVTVERGQIEIPEINVGIDNFRKLYLNLASWTNAFVISNNPEEPETSGTQLLLKTITEAGTYSYTLTLKDKENYVWVDKTNTQTTEDKTLTWVVHEIKMEDLKWETANGAIKIENGHKFIAGQDDANSQIILPQEPYVGNDIAYKKFYNKDGTPFDTTNGDYPTAVGEYYVVFEKAGIQENGHYIVTGESARLDFSIVAAE